MRTLLSLILGGLLGAILFHLYYLRLPAERRCGWDHPLDDHAKAACVADASTPAGNFHGYAKRARKDLDDLIGKVEH